MIINRPRREVPVLVSDEGKEHSVSPRIYLQPLHLCHPERGRDVFALQLLDHQREKFAPAHGPGILVTPAALQRLGYLQP